MAKNDVIGLAIGLDTSSLKAGLADAGRRIRESGAEFQATTAKMDDWRKSTEGLNAKIKQLTKNLSVQEAALELMEKEYKELYEGQDENSAAAVKLRTDILKQKAAIGKTEKEIAQYNKELENLENGTKDSTEALKEQEKAADKVSDGFTTLKGAVAGLITAGITALVAGLVKGTQALLNTSEATREYREDIGKLNAAFVSAGRTTKSATETYQKLYKAIGETDTAVEASQQIALLADSEENVAKWADLATGVVGKFGDALKPETFYEAANETLKLGESTGAFTQMLEQSGISVDTFNEGLAKCTTEQEKQAYMLAVSEKALGAAGKAYEEVNADVMKVREETAEYEATQAELGAKMEGVNGTIMEFKNELLKTIMSEVDFEKVAQTLNETLTKFKDEIIPKVIEGFKWVKDNLPAIKTAVIGLGAAFVGLKVANIVMGIVKAVKLWVTATQGMTIAQRALNLVMKANPIGLIISLVAGLVAVIVHLWNTNDDFRKAVIKIWDNIKKAISKAIDAVVKVFNKVLDFVKNNWQSLLLLLVNPFWGAFKLIWDHSEKFRNFWISLWNSIKQAFANFGTWISGTINSIGQWFVNLWQRIKNTFSNVGTWFGNIFSSAWTNIKNAFSKVGSFFSGIWTTIKNKFTDIGQKIGESISSAFKKAINAVLKTAEKVLNAPIKAINDLIDKIKEVVNIPKLKPFNLPRMAQGGVVNKATLGIFGEDGAEAVIPLEKNLGWIKKLSANIVKEMNPNLSGVATGITTNNTTQFTQIINAPKQPALDDLYRQSKNLLDLKVGG